MVGDRRRRWQLAAGLAVVAAVVAVVAVLAPGNRPSGRPAATSPPGPAGPPHPDAGLIGVNVNYVFNDRAFTGPQQLAIARTLAATGVGDARGDALWEATEPAPGRFDPSFDDGEAGTLAAAGLRWLPIIDYAPQWARQTPGLLHSPPANPATYAAFASWLARRYGSGGTFWAAHPALRSKPVRTYEVWNEPDAPLFWSPRPDPLGLARLYLGARAAIHRVDPQAVVLLGGLVNPSGTLPRLLAAAPALASALDGVAIHPYGTTTTISVLAAVREARRALDRLGLASVPLYVTEFGWVTAPPGAHHYVPASVRPGLVRATVDALSHTDCGVDGEVLYTWVTPRRNPDDAEDWYGIEPVTDAQQGTLSPEASALRSAVAAARAAGPRLRLCG